VRLAGGFGGRRWRAAGEEVLRPNQGEGGDSAERDQGGADDEDQVQPRNERDVAARRQACLPRIGCDRGMDAGGQGLWSTRPDWDDVLAWETALGARRFAGRSA